MQGPPVRCTFVDSSYAREVVLSPGLAARDRLSAPPVPLAPGRRTPGRASGAGRGSGRPIAARPPRGGQQPRPWTACERRRLHPTLLGQPRAELRALFVGGVASRPAELVAGRLGARNR